MNGQMYQICCIAASTRNALKSGSSISYTPMKYENKLEFQFQPEEDLLGTFNFKADNITTWYKRCLDKGMEEVKLLAPINVKDRNILGFSNTTQSILVCFFRNGRVSYFSSNWQFDSLKKMWDVLYTEYEWNNAPMEKPRFDDNTEAFKIVLKDIEKLAKTIGCDNFAKQFKKATDILNSASLNKDEKCISPLQIPQKNLCIFEAASIADVFGAMGSWNDSPPYMAFEKGLAKEYETLSSELLEQLRLAILYAINEW